MNRRGSTGKAPLCPLSYYWCGMAVAALVAGCGGGGTDPTATTPELVYEDGFLSPLEEVRIEAADGTIVRGYDAWLKLLPRTDLVARYEADFSFRGCAEPRAYFARVLGSDPLSSDEANLVCREYRDSRFDFDNGRWLVEDRADGRVYFRVWKHHNDAGQRGRHEY